VISRTRAGLYTYKAEGRVGDRKMRREKTDGEIGGHGDMESEKMR